MNDRLKKRRGWRAWAPIGIGVATGFGMGIFAGFFWGVNDAVEEHVPIDKHIAEYVARQALGQINLAKYCITVDDFVQTEVSKGESQRYDEAVWDVIYKVNKPWLANASVSVRVNLWLMEKPNQTPIESVQTERFPVEITCNST